MLILLSSGARRRYRDDIVRALAHPAGTYLQFRYGVNYVEPSMLANARKNALSGRAALICHLADRPDDRPACLVPIRFTMITRTQFIGSSLVVTLVIGDYVQKLDDAGLRQAMTDDEKALIPNQGSDATAPAGRFFFDMAAPLTAKSAPKGAEMVGFEATTEALRDVGFGSTEPPMAFYAIRNLTVVGSDSAEQVINPKDGVYTLKSGTRYALAVYSFSPEGDKNPSDTSTLLIEADDSEVKFSSETAAKLDSRYDLNRFRFSIEPRTSNLSTGLRVALGVPSLIDGKTVQEERCDVTLELRFRSSNLLTAGRVLVIAAGTTGPALVAAMVRPEWSWGLAPIMLIPALFAAWGVVFPNFKKS